MNVLWRMAKGLAKTLGVAILAVLLFVVLFVGALIVIPEFHLTGPQVTSLVTRFAPETLALTFTEFDLRLQRPKERWLAKRLVLDTQRFCARYEGDAVIACLDSLHFAMTLSLDGIERIEPIELLGVNVHADLPKLPKKEKKDESGGFDVVGFLRKHVIPKWDLDGSRVELHRLVLKTAPGVGYTAAFDLEGAKSTGAIDVKLHEFRSLDGPLFASANAKIVRPASWGGRRSSRAEANQWKIGLAALLKLDNARRFDIDGDANVTSLRELDARLRVRPKGVKPLREGRLALKLVGSDADGTLSLKLGAAGSQVRALDFVDCSWRANLDKKVGNLHCGPESVRLIVKEQSFLRRPDLFTLRPVFDLNVKRLYFGEVKGADVDLDLKLDHEDFVTLGLKTDATFRKGEGPAKYSVTGGFDLALREFSSLVTLLRETPYSIPAPLNVLKGRVGITSKIDLTQDGGEADYQLATDLSSTHQAVRFMADGSTKFEKRAKGLHPSTDVTVEISDVRLSAPRFDLRTPPPMKPDGRFGPIEEPAVVNARNEKSEPMDFKLRVKTRERESVRIATNLTKGSIPLGFDVVYDATVVPTLVGSKRSPVSGWVVVGRTPVDLFKRNAVLEEMRIDLLENGQDRVNGRVTVSYLEYTIQMLIMGAMREPQIRFYSDPPLDDDQIVAVLLFGRPDHELGEDEKTSAASLHAAMTDAVLSVSSLYMLASTPVESVGYDSERGRVTARVGLGGGASLELGGGSRESGSGVGIRKRLTKDLTFRSEVETLGTSGKRTISALVEWVRRF